MKKSLVWLPLLPLVGVWAVWSCAVDDRSPGVAVEPSRMGTGGSATSGNGNGAGSGPVAEAANGCSGEEPCVDRLVNGKEGDVSCPGCFLGGECRAAGELNADNPCQVCDPGLDRAGWSPNDGAACEDGAFCTTDDRCRAGACVGTERVCEDGVACNGRSVCLEADKACSPDENQCNDPPLCNVATNECVAECGGCVVDGVCFAAGAAPVQNPCFVCDPELSKTGLSAAPGRPCGAAATECSAQDTCNSEGRCEPNDLQSGAPCGAAVLDECDVADVCDGNGRCLARRAENGSACEDGSSCTVGAQCQAGSCLGGAPRSCGPNERCSEESGGCACAGCTIAGNCIAAGAPNPANACQVCDPARSAQSYSANVGASCGAVATECSGQDTCNEQGQCAPNHLAAGAACGAPGGDQCDVGDSCDGNGQCLQRVARNGDPCDDGQFCTSGDTCQGTVCRSGGPRDCGPNQACDEANRRCRCTGCLINGNCLAAGARNPANACQICDPSQNSSGFVNDVGANCGAPASACSAQDTCNAQGQCQPNDLPQGTACGGPVSGPCDAPDTCSGQGQCIARQAANGVACEDGLFCTQGDTCQNGACVSGGRNCGNQACDENANRCGADNGQPCTVSSDCLAGTCRTWFQDNDGDQYGGSTTIRTCGNNPPGGFVAQGGDCCDLGGANAAAAAQVHPDQQRFFAQGQIVCPNIAALDFNCSGAVEVGPHPPLTQCRDLTLSECSSPETATVWGTDFAPTPDLCGFPAQASLCQPVFNGCDDLGETTFIGIPCH